jgi:hypothetical protein
MHQDATAAAISRRALELKAVFLGQVIWTGISAAAPRDVLAAMNTLCGATEPTYDDLPITVGEETEPFCQQHMASAILHAHQRMSGDSRVDDIMTAAMTLGAMRIGDLITRGNHRDRAVPLLEFARHLRNAAAHGGTWHFRPHEPASPATLGDRSLTRHAHGTQTFFAWVSPQLYALFLDEVHHHFRRRAIVSGEPLQSAFSTMPNILP